MPASDQQQSSPERSSRLDEDLRGLWPSPEAFVAAISDDDE